jgi:preprotein translocase subunit YajC
MAGTFYLLIWRPQQRRLAGMRALQEALRLGDEVITTGGIFGTITALREDHIELEVAPGVVIKVARGAIGSRVTNAATGDTDVEIDRPDGDGDTA